MRFSLLLIILLSAMQSRAQKSNYNLIVGTYTNSGKSKGIYVYNFDVVTAAVYPKSIAEEIQNPSYLCLGPQKKSLYCVNESGNGSTVSAFSWEPKAGKLHFLNKRSTEGADPCYLIADEQHVISANYSGGSTSIFGRQKDGQLGDLQQLVHHEGNSVNRQRQNEAHVHMTVFSPDHQQVLVSDLGTDKIYVYDYHPERETEVLTLKDSYPVTPGAGPRHLCFNKKGTRVYMLREMDAGISVFRYKKGVLQKIQESSLNREGFNGENGAADIHLSPDGKFLYASNRGSENNLTYFSVDNDGLLTNKGQISTQGKGPRNFVIDPTGKYLLVGNQGSDAIVIFKRNLSTGELTDTGKRIEVGQPVCLVFAPDH